MCVCVRVCVRACRYVCLYTLVKCLQNVVTIGLIVVKNSYVLKTFTVVEYST